MPSLKPLPCRASSIFCSRTLHRYVIHPSPLHQLTPLHSAPHPATHNKRALSNQPQRFYSSSSPSSANPQSKHYTFEDLRLLASKPDPARLIIDVREPGELQETGRVPGAVNMPITSNPEAFFLSNEDFFDRFGFERPRSRAPAAGAKTTNPNSDRSPFTPEMKDREAAAGLGADGVDSSERGAMSSTGNATGEVEEVIFYCKAGVRSRAAARMAREWEGVKIGDMRGGWNEWSEKNGEVERV